MLPPVGSDTPDDDLRHEREHDAEGLYRHGPKRAKNPLPRLIAEAMVSFAPLREAPATPVERRRTAGKESRRLRRERREAGKQRGHPWKRQMAAVPLGARAA